MHEWDDLRFFLAIWRARTLSGAARMLKVNQTTVARRLGALESQLGALLFDRSPDGFSVTTAGQNIVPVATQMEEAALTLDRLVAGSDEKLDGTVRLACSESLAIGFVLERLAAFRAAHPGISVTVTTGNLPINLMHREADLAIRTPRPTQSDLVVRKLVDVEWYAYLVEGAAPLGRDVIGFGGRDAVGFEGDLAGVRPAQWLSQQVPPECVAVRCNSILSAETAIRSGAGVGVLPAFLAERAPGLVRAIAEPISTHAMWLAVHPDLQKQTRVRVLMEYLVTQFHAHRARFAGPRPP